MTAQSIRRTRAVRFLDFATIGLDVGVDPVSRDMDLRKRIQGIVPAVRKVNEDMLLNPGLPERR